MNIEIHDGQLTPNKPWSLQRLEKPFASVTPVQFLRETYVSMHKMHSIGYNARVVGGDQMASARDIKDFAKDLSRGGYISEASKYDALSKRLKMLGEYNYRQGVELLPNNSKRILPNRHERKRRGLPKPKPLFEIN